jgi:hypothetical protein
MRRLLLAVCLLPALIACGEEEPTPPAPPTIEEKAAASTALFREVFNSGAYERIPEAEAAMLAVYAEDPKQDENTLLLGALYFWSAAEWSRDSSRGVPALVDTVMKMERYLGESVVLRPNDARAWCWYGAAKLFRGRFESNNAMLQEGAGYVNKCADMYPQFGLIMVAFTNSHLPISTPNFKTSVDAIWKNVEVCINKPMDQTNPDFTPFLYMTANTQPPYYACWNSKAAPHNLEGFWLFMGDVMVKDNRPAVARRLYENAKLADNYKDWKYKSYLDQAIETADARAALYRDSDPKNDPPVVPQTNFQCVSCHAR